MSLKLERADAVALAEDLGFKAAASYNGKKLTRRLSERIADGDVKELKEDLTKEGVKILLKFKTALDEETKIIIPDASDDNDSDDDEKPAKSKKSKENGKPDKKSDKSKGNSNFAGRYGIGEAIKELLQGASKKSPISRAEMYKKLTKKFPKHDEQAIKRTLNGQVSYHLKKANFIAGNPETGYWARKG